MKQLVLPLVLVLSAAAQTSTDTTQSTSDPAATAKLSVAYSAFAGSNSIKDVHIEGAVTEHAGEGTSGTFIYDSTADGRTKLQLNLGKQTRTEFGSAFSELIDCSWMDSVGTRHAIAAHNCLTPSALLLPLLALNPQQTSVIFKTSTLSVNGADLVDVERKGKNAEARPLSRSTVVLKKTDNLPVAITFTAHADNDAHINIPVEIIYSDYRDVNGVKVPYSIKKSMNGSTVLEFTAASVQFNTGTEAK